MNERTKLGIGVLATALVLGLLGDALLRAMPWGLNVFLWVGALAAGARVLARRGGARHAPEGAWLWAAALTFAAFFAWRDSFTLRFLDAVAILAALSLAAYSARGGRVRVAGVFEYALAAVVAGLTAAFGALPLIFSDVRWRNISRTGWSKHTFAVARGLLIAAPLLLLFGGLFVAADAVFEGLIHDTFNFVPEVVLSHALVFAFFSWTAAGYLRGTYLADGPFAWPSGRAAQTPPGLGLSSAEVPRTPADGDPKTKGSRAGDSDGDAPAVATTMPPGGYRFSAGEEEEARAGFVRVGAGFGAGEEPSPKAPGETTKAHERTETDKGTNAAEDAKAGGVPTAAADASSASPASSIFPRPSLGIVEVGVVLGLLDLLFFSFVAVQISYLFGDARHVVNSAGLTFSDYARRGFFELVWVAILALPLLLAAHWLLRKDNVRNERVFRALAGTMVALLFAVMASAVWRMRLYQAAYGLTELRFYTTAFMGWLGVVFVWFVLTVLRGRRERFAFGALAAWLVVLVALHALDPGDLIVRTNLDHARAGGRPERFDSHYATSLGADAVPALVEAFDGLGERERGAVAASLTRWLDAEAVGDWRSWNLSRSRAVGAVREREASLRGWEARWKEEEAARIAASRRKMEAGFATLPGTTFKILVERRPADSSAGYRRTATLVAGDSAVAALELPADDGARTRVEVFKVSDTVYLLRDAYGSYVADLERRTLSRRDDAGYSALILVGAFDTNGSKSWDFVPAASSGGFVGGY